MPDSLIDRAGTLLREAANGLVLPRFQALAHGEVEEKSPGEIVTIADREAEAWLTPRLAALVPGSRVVGEEAVETDPRLLDGIERGLAWLVDPVDGTANFVDGSPRFAVMAALLRDGDALAAWILDPVTGTLAAAERGAGAAMDGIAIRVPAVDPEASKLHGALHCRFMPAHVREAIEARQGAFASTFGGLGCAGHEYRDLAAGARHFSVYWRTHPWDHVPGALLLTEAGGHCARLDGTPYRAGDQRTGLLAAITPGAWEAVRGELALEVLGAEY
ncbi:MAG: inositol monophosphatase [Dehalococcoidia bacterium]|nr:inositol monophosphatase [Dehalococcoidia bacterium]